MKPVKAGKSDKVHSSFPDQRMNRHESKIEKESDGCKPFEESRMRSA
jgi:hypothetical protein